MANGVPDSYLIKRAGTWHYRRRVPADVQPYVGLKWWKKSLKTGAEGESKERARVLARRHDDTIAVARGASTAVRHSWLTDVSADAAIAGQYPQAHAAATAADTIEGEMIAAAERQLGKLPEAQRAAVAKAGGVAAFLARTDADAFNLELKAIELQFDRALGRIDEREADVQQAALQAYAPHIANDQRALLGLGLAEKDSIEWRRRTIHGSRRRLRNGLLSGNRVQMP